MFHAVRGGAARTERSLLTSRLAGATREQVEVSLMEDYVPSLIGSTTRNTKAEGAVNRGVKGLVNRPRRRPTCRRRP